MIFRSRYRRRIITGIFSLIILLILNSCKEDFDDELAVLSERVLLTGSDKIRFSGRIISILEVDLDDHGFEVSVDEQFSSVQAVSLGEKKANAEFIGEVTGLSAGVNYWWRSYIVVAGVTLYGETRPVTTQETSLLDFQAKIGRAGIIVTLTGRNFPEELSVSFGDEEAVIVKQSDYFIEVRVPPIASNYLVPLKVETADATLTYAQPFEYVIGKWEALSDFPQVGKAPGAVTLLSGTEVVFGLGSINSSLNSTVWISDLNTFNWSAFTYPGPAVRDAFHSGKYFGGGLIDFPPFPGANIVLSDKLWSYENGTFTEEATTPFQLYQAVAFDTGTELYVLGGRLANNAPNEEIYKYSIADKSWTYVSDLPFSVYSSQASFYHDGIIYILDAFSDLYRFQISTKTWEYVSTFPENETEVTESVVLGNKAYIGLAGGRRTMYEFDLSSYTWKAKENVPVSRNIDSYSAWANDGKLYFLLNTQLQGNNQIDLWEFNPETF